MANRGPVESPGQSGNPPIVFADSLPRPAKVAIPVLSRILWMGTSLSASTSSIRGPHLPSPAPIRPVTDHPKTWKLPNEPKSPSIPCHPKALPCNIFTLEVVAASKRMSPRNEPKFVSQPGAACSRPCGQIRPNQTTFFAAPQSIDTGQRRSAGAEATPGRFRLVHLVLCLFSNSRGKCASLCPPSPASSQNPCVTVAANAVPHTYVFIPPLPRISSIPRLRVLPVQLPVFPAPCWSSRPKLVLASPPALSGQRRLRFGRFQPVFNPHSIRIPPSLPAHREASGSIRKHPEAKKYFRSTANPGPVGHVPPRGVGSEKSRLTIPPLQYGVEFQWISPPAGRISTL